MGKRKRVATGSLYVDPRGVQLMVCRCGHVQQGERLTIWPRCLNCYGELQEMPVSCASIKHNDNGGCDNPTCWKYNPTCWKYNAEE